MLNPQLLMILRSLSKNESESFNDFLYSPFFNKSKTIHKFWNAIKIYSPAYDDPKLTRENLFLTIFPGKEFNYGTIMNLMLSFSGMLEEFLQISFHKADKFQHDYNSLVFSIVRYYPDLFKKKYSKIIKDFEKLSEGMEYHYLYKYQILRLASSFSNFETKKTKSLFDQGDSLIYFFLIHLFQVSYNIKTFSLSENYEQKGNLTEEMINLIDIDILMKKIKANSSHDFQIVDLYYNLYLCRMYPDNDEHFYSYKKKLFITQNLLHEFEFEALVSGFIALLDTRSFSGKEGTLKETSDLYNYIVENKIRLGFTENRISKNYFGIILKNFFNASDIKFAEIFYNDNFNHLIEKDRESIKNLYSAYLCYTNNEFGKALEHSSMIKTDTDKFRMYVKEFQLKCYFELNETEHFGYTLKAYRELVYRSETINSDKKEYTKIFLNVINSLFEYKVFKKEKLDDVRINIKENKMLNKEWIIQKLKEIESVK
ncbi:hypothetical protein BH10BAC5_BH10BAC5_15630 [soil metagenome]